ncbi:MAG TPA: CaiB/BaiF CoA-transferase family protein [Candidatus Binatia bacterium]|nr:CaiB/BaiF CoA-transferase family protein [Candidatus Binatia bacterium]
MTADPKPLSDVTVLDLTQAWAGPYCTMMLADAGARVVKVEPPGTGDHVRKWTVAASKGESPHFIAVNRNKRSLTLNLKDPRGRALLLRLAARSDVLVENFRPGVMRRFGLDYDALRAVAPAIVYCSISGFGQTGPYAEHAAYDLVIQAAGGAMSVTGEEGGRPLKPGIPQADVMGGLAAAFTIMAALHGRARDGRGRRLDLAMLDMQVSAMGFHVVSYALSGEVPRPMGAKHPLLAPYEAFRTATDEIAIGIANDDHWRRLCETLGLEDEPRLSTNAGRVAHREELARRIEEVVRMRPAEAWTAELTARGIPCARINDVPHLVDDPQIRHRRMIQTLEHPTLGRMLVPGVPWKLVPTEEEPAPTPPPSLGQHTDAILAELGCSDAEIAALRGDGVV